MQDDDGARQLASLQATLDRLAMELAEARGELQALRRAAHVADAPPAPDVPMDHVMPGELPPAPAERAPRTSREAGRGNTERLVGKYGALALGALTIVMGVGALVSWAVTNDLLGPRMRVALGTVITLALAALGARVREQHRRFGNTLLALSVALLQVVAWGAGPALGLASPTVSLIAADAGSIALAALAVQEGSEALFVVGFGAALLAPFVLRTGTPRFGLLGAYGLIMIAAALRGSQRRPWRFATGVATLGTLLYAATLSGYAGRVVALHHLAGAVFALVVALFSLRWPRDRDRPGIGLAAVLVAALACSWDPNTLVTSSFAALAGEPARLAVHVSGALVALAVVRGMPRTVSRGGWVLAAVLLPVLFLDDPVNLLPTHRAVSASLRFAWAAMYVVAATADGGERRAMLLALGGLVSGWALALVTPVDVRPFALALHAVLFAFVAQRSAIRLAIVPSVASLVVGFLFALRLLALRGYASAPFLTPASAASAAVVLAAWLVVRVGAREHVAVRDLSLSRPDLARASSVLLAFVWGAVECALAISHDVATFLLVFYLAACGVASLGVGRARRIEALRQVGLAVAVSSALYALASVSGVQQIGFRVGSYLAVGAFLMGVAWWYRAEVAPGP